jgi:DNA-binding XRE family transcriptional regulator
LDRDVFKRLCAEQGAHTEEARAGLAGVDRNTVRRWCRGDNAPLVSIAIALAQKLETTVEELWPEVAA